MKNTGIVIFSHRRDVHLKKLLDSLVLNQTDLPITIYIDMYEKNSEIQFKLKTLIEKYSQKLCISEIILRPEKFGLKKNILAGISKSFKNYEKLIILEEDLILSENAISYFVNCLNEYQNTSEVFHVNGWSKPLDYSSYEYDLFLTNYMQCVGWATWKHSWSEFEQFLNQDFIFLNKNEIKKLDLKGNLNNVDQLIKNNLKFINTWAVYWQLFLFKKNKLSIAPLISQIFHGGFDELSTHNYVYEIKQSNLQNNKIDSENIQKDSAVYDNLLEYSFVEKPKLNYKNITFSHALQTILTKMYYLFQIKTRGKIKVNIKDIDILNTFVQKNL